MVCTPVLILIQFLLAFFTLYNYSDLIRAKQLKFYENIEIIYVVTKSDYNRL